MTFSIPTFDVWTVYFIVQVGPYHYQQSDIWCQKDFRLLLQELWCKSLQWFLLTCRDVVHLSFLGVAIIKYMWRLNYSSYYFLFDVFQCILVGDSKGELTVYQLRSMPEPPANQVCLSLYIVWHNTVLIKGISKTLSNIHGLIPQASRALC